MERYWIEVVVKGWNKEDVVVYNEEEGIGYVSWKWVEKYVKGNVRKVGNVVKVDYMFVGWYADVYR